MYSVRPQSGRLRFTHKSTFVLLVFTRPSSFRGDATQRNILIGFGSLMSADELHGVVYIRRYIVGQQTVCNGYHNRVRESGQ